MEQKISLEKIARKMPFCPVCGDPKTQGDHAQIVCWGECWRNPNWGLKYTQLETNVWLNKYAKK